MHEVLLTSKAAKDKIKLKKAKLQGIAKKFLNILSEDLFKFPPPYEKLGGDLKGLYMCRINQEHRIIYAVNTEEGYVKVTSIFSYYY